MRAVAPPGDDGRMSYRPVIVKQSNTPVWILVIVFVIVPIVCCCGALAFWPTVFAIDTGFTFEP